MILRRGRGYKELFSVERMPAIKLQLFCFALVREMRGCILSVLNTVLSVGVGLFYNPCAEMKGNLCSSRFDRSEFMEASVIIDW